MAQKIFDPTEELRSAIPHVESFQNVLSSVRDWHDQLCDLIAGQSSFTLTLEIRGDGGYILHSRVKSDSFRNPRGVEKLIEEQKEGQPKAKGCRQP